MMTEQIESASALMVRDYLILAFLVSLGALQIAVSISGLRGLWLVPHRVATRTLGVLLVILGIGFYVFAPLWMEGPWAAGTVIDGTSEGREWGLAASSEISGARNLNDIHGGMAGTAYAGFFIFSAVLATLFSAAVGIFTVRLSATDSAGDDSDGLDAMKESHAFSALTRSLRVLWRDGTDDARRELRAAPRWSIAAQIERIRRN